MNYNASMPVKKAAVNNNSNNRNNNTIFNLFGMVGGNDNSNSNSNGNGNRMINNDGYTVISDEMSDAAREAEAIEEETLHMQQMNASNMNTLKHRHMTSVLVTLGNTFTNIANTITGANDTTNQFNVDTHRNIPSDANNYTNFFIHSRSPSPQTGLFF